MLFLFAAVTEAPPLPQSGDKSEDRERSVRMAQMRELAATVVVYAVTEKGRTPVELVQTPLMRWSDMSRGRLDGTIWVWGRTGRPAAIMELYTQVDGAGNWVHVIHSLSTGQVTAEIAGGLPWSPRRPGLELKPFPGSPAPASEKAARLRQAKELARRFSAHQFWDPNNQRSQLRLLPQPIYQYEDPSAGLPAGTVFTFVHGTDTEIILLVELAQREAAPPQWQYGLVRLGHAEFHVSLDDREVWQQERIARTSPMEPYHLFFRRPSGKTVPTGSQRRRSTARSLPA
jgi:hypothetical protein